MAQSFNDDSFLFNFIVNDGNGVKGLVDSGLTEIPSRFIQPPHLRIDKKQITASPKNTVIDLSDLHGPNHDRVVKDIVYAAETVGFFQVVNHGVPLDLLESLKAAAHLFFSQPVEKKAAYLKGVSPSPMIWYGTSFLPEKMKALEWKDYISMTYTNDAEAIEFWPSDCNKLVLEYIKKATELVKELLKVLILNLEVNINESRINTLIDVRTARMNFYPPCPNPELTVGVGCHSDLDTLTVLLQDEIGGLYVKNEERLSQGNNEWIEVPAIHGSLVIHVGDNLQILSNGRYKSAEHIVQTTSAKSRVSIPIFTCPPPMEKIGPLPDLVSRDGVARYKEVIFQEYRDNLKKLYSKSIGTTSIKQLMKEKSPLIMHLFKPFSYILDGVGCL